jgi:HAE1 family hydrophobic/amphiphilic exporter-1
VFATGPGKIGNRTIGTAAAGGCLLVPFVVYLFLACIFGRIAEIQAGKSEEENPLTEEIDNNEVHK